MRMMRLRDEKSRRKAQTLTQSWTIRIGSTIAAALTGEIDERQQRHRQRT